MSDVDTTPVAMNGAGSTGSGKILIVIEDDPDVQFLIEAIFAMDPRFSVSHVAESRRGP